MRTIEVADFDTFRAQARAALARRVSPPDLLWIDAADKQRSLLPSGADETPVASSSSQSPPRVPAAFVARARTAAHHADPGRWSLLYRIAFRLTGGEPRLLEDETDDDVRRLFTLERAVHVETHDMRAYVRFHAVPTPAGERLVAWYAPAHDVLPLVAQTFLDRMLTNDWSVLTPRKSAHGDGGQLTFGRGVPRTEAPAADQLEGIFATYYAAIFNPARLNVRALASHIPKRRWSALPELAALPTLRADAPARVSGMLTKAPSAAPFLPADTSWGALAQAARVCTGCPLAGPATGTVFGEGPEDARLVLVGEQPGDEEDKCGRPFVGPAGAILDAALMAVGLDRRALYVTNAVKHFKFVVSAGGKRRLHQKPSGREVQACRPSLAAELARVRPHVVVALGGTAASAIFGPGVRPTSDRGRLIATPFARHGFVTYHPSAILRAGEPHAAAVLKSALHEDLARAAEALRTAS